MGQEQASENKELRAACHDMAKMEAGIFGMPIDSDREGQLYQYYKERKSHRNDES